MNENVRNFILALVGVLVIGYFCSFAIGPNAKKNNDRQPTPVVTSTR